jgi:hypothetical protein
VPDPPLASLTPGMSSSSSALATKAAATAAAAAMTAMIEGGGGRELAVAAPPPCTIAASSATDKRAGNGNALSQNWRRAVLDSGDVKAQALSQAVVSETVGLALFTRLLCSQNTVQMMTASMFHVTNLTPGSANQNIS